MAAEWPDGQRARVAVLNDWWWPELVGGAEITEREFSYGLASRGYDVRVFVPARDTRQYSDGPLLVQRVRVRTFRDTYTVPKAVKAIEVALHTVTAAASRRLGEAVALWDPTVILVGNLSRLGVHAPTGLAAANARTPMIRIHHDLSDVCWRRSMFKDSPCDAVCASCQVKCALVRRATPDSLKARVVVSDFVGRHIEGAGLVRDEPVITGYPTLVDVAALREPGSKGAATSIGYIGRLEEIKGVHVLIEAVARMQERDSVRLVIAGKGSSAYRSRLMDLAERLGVACDLVGFMDVDTFARRVDIAAVPSIWPEPFGRVPVELASRGVPVAVSAIGGLTEAVEGLGGRVRLVTPGDPTALSTALRELLAEPYDLPMPSASEAVSLLQVLDDLVSVYKGDS